MDKINFDSFYKFLISLGIALVILPFIVLFFLCTNSFDLMVTEEDLATYTSTARSVIEMKQSIPLLVERKIMWVIFACFLFFGLALIVVGVIKWYSLQKLDDRYKELETEMKIADAKKHIKEMSDEQIISKSIEAEKAIDKNNLSLGMKLMLIEQRFYNMIKEEKVDYLVKNNIMIGNCQYDVVALSNTYLSKDFVYQIKYISRKISSEVIDRYRNNMEEQKYNFAEQMNRLPYMVLTLIVLDELYEYTSSEADRVDKRNNFAIRVLPESKLSKY